MPEYHVPKPPRPRPVYLPLGAAPSTTSEEVEAFRSAIPDWLQPGECWVSWDYTWVPDRGAWTKLPLAPRSPGRTARVNDQHSWATLEEAIGFRRRYKAAGVARVLVAGARLLGGDVDHVAHPAPELAPRGAYTEVSPGGHGVRFFLRGAFPEPGRQGRKCGDVELYGGGRFLTVTGRVLQPAGDVDAAAVAHWYDQHFPPPPVLAVPGGVHDRRPPRSDHEVLERARAARNGDRFAALWRGDTSFYGGDHSRADLALVGCLWWWTGGDAARVDRLFRQSGLMRPKWDAPRGGTTYGGRTIATLGVLGGVR